MPLEPNARCPICGAAVYFWQNSQGSRVYFDALGAPWPKHPCLDLWACAPDERERASWARQATTGALQPRVTTPAPTEPEIFSGSLIFVLIAVFIVTVSLTSMLGGSPGLSILMGLTSSVTVALLVLADPRRRWDRTTAEATLALKISAGSL